MPPPEGPQLTPYASQQKGAGTKPFGNGSSPPATGSGGLATAAAMAGFAVVVKVTGTGSALNCMKFGSLCPSTSARIWKWCALKNATSSD